MDNKSINNKTTPNQMRIFLKRMRGGKYEVNEIQDAPKHELSMRDLLKITRTRKLNEQAEEDNKENAQNIKIDSDQNREEDKFRDFFNNNNITINVEFIDLEAYNNLVFWGGTINGIIQFTYKVPADERTSSGVEFNYLDDYSPDNPENDEIVKMVKTYYDTFAKYWNDKIQSNE